MKKLRLQLLLFCSLLCFGMSAQISNGTTAPDWTATDLDGVEHNMYDILNSGKHVILEFSAIWCGPCWNFHNTGTLEDLHDMYGPDGTDQIRVFYIEADQNTNTDCLYGLPTCNGNSYGDWVTGHDFSFIDLMPGNANSMDNDYQVGYFPTIYAVSANGNNGVYEVGQVTNLDTWANWFFNSFELMADAPVVSDASCPGEGSISVSSTGGQGTVSYNWSNGQSGSEISGLNAGTYTVSMTDSYGYFITETYEVQGPAEPLDVELVLTNDVVCFEGANGELEVEGLGGNGGYTYLWSNGATTSSITGLSEGLYSVVVTDAEGCTTENSYTIEGPDTEMVLTTAEDDTTCGEENGEVFSSVSGGNGPWSYSYGAGSNTSGYFSSIAPGVYEMTVTDVNGCESFSGFEIFESAPAMAEATPQGEVTCASPEVIISGEGSSTGPFMTYVWETTDGVIVSGEDELDVVVSASGTYSLTVFNTITGCTMSASTSVEANVDYPTVEVNNPGSLTCDITTMIVDGSASESGDDITYQWTTEDGNIENGASTNTITVDAAGTYTLSVINSNTGCTSTESVEVSEDVVVPSLTVNDAVIDCNSTEVELCADVEAGTMVRWMTSTGEVESTCITVNAAGEYTAIATGANGCESESIASVSLSADLPQVTTQSPETLTCTVESVMLNAEVEGEISDFNIMWTDAEGNTIEGNGLAIEVDAPGEYSIIVTNTSNGCATTSNFNVEEVIVNPESSFTFDLDDGDLSLSSNSGGDPSSYSWNFGGTNADEQVVFDENGTYEICLTVVNDCGEDTYCQDVEYITAFTYDGAAQNALCAGEATGSITITPTGGLPDYTASWTGPNGYVGDGLEITDLSPGDYNLVLTDANGTERTEVYTITEPEAIMQSGAEIITGETNDEANGSISLVVEGGTGDLSYLWSNGATTLDITDLTAGDYTLVVTDGNGCEREFGPYTVESIIVGTEDLDFVKNVSVYPIPTRNYLNIDLELTQNENITLRVIDSYGKVHSQMTTSGREISTNIDVEGLPSGIYFLEIGNAKDRSLEKFVVIK